MKRLLLAMMLLMGICMGADAQGFLNRLKDKALQTVQGKVENKVDQTVSEGMDAVLDGKSSKKDKKSKDAEMVDVSGADDTTPATATSSDFKRGSIIIFDDDVTAEQVGEFPSKWGMFQGTVETKTLGGVKAINLTDNAQVQPLIEQEGPYLPEEFTIEYDFYFWPTDKVPGNDDYIGLNDMKMILAVTKDRSEYPGEGADSGDLTAFVLTHGVCSFSEHSYYFLIILMETNMVVLTTRSRRAGTMWPCRSTSAP